MGDDRKALRERFAVRDCRPEMRRIDFKGYRHGVYLRVAERMADDLQLIKLVTGETKNGFCERALKAALDAAIEELRNRHGSETWQAFEVLAKRARRKERPR